MFLMAYSQGLDKELDEESIFFMLSPVLTMFAMDTMVIAFTCVVLAPSLWLAISVCLIGLNFFFFVYLVRWINPKMISIKQSV